MKLQTWCRRVEIATFIASKVQLYLIPPAQFVQYLFPGRVKAVQTKLTLEIIPGVHKHYNCTIWLSIRYWARMINIYAYKSVL